MKLTRDPGRALARKIEQIIKQFKSNTKSYTYLNQNVNSLNYNSIPGLNKLS